MADGFDRRAILTTVISATVVNIVATTMYLPAIPAIAKELGTDIRSVQMLLTVYLITSAVGQLVLGPLSDATGRRRLLIGAGLVCAVLSIACASAYSIVVLIVLRLFQGVTGSAFVVVTRAVVRDINDRSSGTARDMAGLLLMIAFVAPISQTIGGVLTDHFSWRITFGVLAAVSSLAFALAWLAFPETNLTSTGALSLRGYATSYAELLSSREFLAYSAINIILFSTLYFFYNAFPIVLIERFDLSPTAYGPIALLCAAGMFFGSLFSNRLAPSHGLDRLLIVGISVSGVAGATMIATAWYGELRLAVVIGVPFVWFLGYGVSMPNAVAGTMSVNPKIAGAAAALLGFLQIGAGAIGSGISGLVDGAQGLFVVVGGLALLNVLVRWIASRLMRPPPTRATPR
ncbi:MAG TPA: Bcr/CflA family efflux MFS transporter [Bradyrhizobium sp.]|nr:Bcr/CflA family efflux MFS transporter [Bradyrhizobium sp.]